MMKLEDIAKRLELRFEYVRDRLVKKKGFPRPALELSQKERRWNEDDFNLWLDKERKKMHK